MKFGFIGAGKVGFSLGKYLADNGQNVVGYYSEFVKDAVEASKFIGSDYYDSMEQLVQDSEVLFLTVPDNMIASVWEQLKQNHISGKFVCHCSGALSSEIFSDISEYACFGFSIHPLFAVSDKYNSYKELSHSYFTIEGTAEKIDQIKALFEHLGNPVCTVSKEDKVRYHTAATIASNLVVGLIGLSEMLLKSCGFDQESAHRALTPIIRGNIEHIVENGVVNALTGPVERNDTETIKKHLATLQKEDKEMYLAVSRQVLQIAQVKNKDRDYSKMKEILK